MYGYYKELEPALSMDAYAGPLPAATDETATAEMMKVVMESVDWFRDVCGESLASYTINTDHAEHPTVWFVTYHFNDEGSSSLPEQTDTFSLLWPADNSDHTDGDISQWRAA